jgi:predicted MFS family arabinose efflux permease
VSYLASLVAIVRIRQPLRQAGDEQREPFLTSMRSGVAFVWQQPFLRAALVWAPISNVAMQGVFFAFIVQLQSNGVPPAGIGVTQAVVMAGGLLGTFLAPLIQRRMSARALIMTMSWLAAALIACMVLVRGSYLIVLPLLIFMLLEPAVNATFLAYQIATTPDELQGRVMGVLGTLSQALSPLGPLLAGFLIESVGGSWAFGGFAILLGLAAIYATASRGIRTLRPIESLVD